MRAVIDLRKKSAAAATNAGSSSVARLQQQHAELEEEARSFHAEFQAESDAMHAAPSVQSAGPAEKLRNLHECAVRSLGVSTLVRLCGKSWAVTEFFFLLFFTR